MKKKIIFVLLCTLMVSFLVAEEVDINSTALGMRGDISMCPGLGLEYQQWIGLNGFSVSASIIESTYSIRAEYERCLYSARLKDTLDSKLFVWVNGGFYSYSYYSYASNESKYHFYGFGALGIGIEFICWDHLSIPVQFGYIGCYPVQSEGPVSFCYSTSLRYCF